MQRADLIQLYVGTASSGGITQMVPITGAWTDKADLLSLKTPEKNPMSLVMDSEKLVVSPCRNNLVILIAHGSSMDAQTGSLSWSTSLWRTQLKRVLVVLVTLRPV